MRVIVAHSGSDALKRSSSALHNVEELLRGNGFQVQPLELPPIDHANPLLSVTSWRLLRLARMADALLCLDACSAALQHPKKYLWLLADLDDSMSVRDQHDYLANVFAAGVRECKRVFAPARAKHRLDHVAWGEVTELDLLVPEPAKDPGRGTSKSYAPLMTALRA